MSSRALFGSMRRLTSLGVRHCSHCTEPAMPMAKPKTSSSRLLPTPQSSFKNDRWRMLRPRNAITTTTHRGLSTDASKIATDLEQSAQTDQEEKATPQVLGTQTGGPKMMIAFTCTVCDTRSTRQFSKSSYEEGVVLVRCPGCDNLHLIADRLGWFDDESVDIETIMREKGEEVGWVTSADGLEFGDAADDKQQTTGTEHSEPPRVEA